MNPDAPDDRPWQEIDPVTARAFARTNAPGICLIVVGILNLLLAGLLIVSGLQVQEMSDQELTELIDQSGHREILTKGVTIEDVRTMVRMSFGMGVVGVLASVVTIVAGMNMRLVKSYRVAVIGAILAAIPGVSCLAFVGIGIAAGIWAIVVLVQPDVKNAFF
jgi:hypothetical protein